MENNIKFICLLLIFIINEKNSRKIEEAIKNCWNNNKL